MPTLNLEKSYRYQGTVYGPGNGLDVPEAVAQVVRASQPPAPDSGPAAVEQAPGDTGLFAVDGVDTSTMEALRGAGFDSPEAIRSANDDDLAAVKGVGPATLEKLREATKRPDTV